MANFDLAIFAGHGTSEVDGTYDSGAVGNGQQEHLVVEQVVNKVVVKLRNSGYNVHRDEQNFKDIDLRGNTYNYKMAISVHINAGGGKRSEAYIPLGEKNTTMEEGILADLAALGIPNGGVRSREYNTGNTCFRKNGVAVGGLDYYKEIRDAWNLGVSLTILELGFIDSSDIYTILDNIDAIADSIARRISILCDKPLIGGGASEPSKPSSDRVYRVRKSWEDAASQIFASSTFEGAKAQCKVGYSVFDPDKKCVYTNSGSTAPSNTIKYRVKDANGKQLNAYSSLDNAKAFAKENKAIVYDMNGKVIVSYVPQVTKKYVNLKSHMNKWNVYPLSVAPVIGNQCGALNPSLGYQYGGLSYTVLEDRGGDVYVINTSSYGRVQIWCPNDADGSVTTKPLYEFVN